MRQVGRKSPRVCRPLLQSHISLTMVPLATSPLLFHRCGLGCRPRPAPSGHPSHSGVPPPTTPLPPHGCAQGRGREAHSLPWLPLCVVHGSPHPVPDEAQPPAPDLLGDKEKGDGLPKANRGVRAPNKALFYWWSSLGVRGARWW